MEMMNIIGQISDLNKVSMEIVKNGSVHMVNAFNEISQNNFTVMNPGQQTDIVANLNFVKQYEARTDYAKTREQVVELMEMLGIEPGIKREYVKNYYDLSSIIENVNLIYNEAKGYKNALDSLNDKIKDTEILLENIKGFQDINIDFDKLAKMVFFELRMGRMSKENYNKLADNIENIPAIIYDIKTYSSHHVFISIAPKIFSEEVDRIFKSLNFEDINIQSYPEGTPKAIIDKLEKTIDEKKKAALKLNTNIGQMKIKYGSFVEECYSKIKMYEKILSVNSETACTGEFFYMAGWIPVSRKKNLMKLLSDFKDRLVVIFKPQEEVSKDIVPPTRLKNNWFVRPFESIVRMYGTPSYNELDPTWFVAITYMFMFGYMFGDVGQGAVFFIAGIILTRLFHRPNLGGVFSRIGASSMIFGVLFGSVFGNEEIISHPLIRPMDNINIVLLFGIAVGVIFTTVSIILNLVNSAKSHDVEDGVFGKNGLVGLIFYWTILITALDMFNVIKLPIPLPVFYTSLCIMLALMLIKQPLANIIKGKKPLYDESPGDYYVEGGFGMLETLISMLSNTISFIRIGAFALNHVGLFIAFATLAKMLSGGAASAAVLVLGNIVIIGLEGLVVFIQGLRLEYYELFSKYYKGDGEDYNPISIKYTTKLPFNETLNKKENSYMLLNKNKDMSTSLQN